MLIGCFKDAKNNDGFMITNYADPELNAKNEVVITFKDAKQILVMSGQKTELLKLNNGVFKKTLRSGEGCFVVPVK